MSQPISVNSQNRYEIKVYGQFDDSWLGWFGETNTPIAVLSDDRQVTRFPMSPWIQLAWSA